MTLEDLCITKFRDTLGEDCYHYEVSHKMTKYSGFGSSSNKNTAISKAVSEWIERQVFRKNCRELNVTSSTGFAVHPCLSMAKESAIAERLERDAFISHWLYKMPPYWLSENELSSQNRELILGFKKRRFDVWVGIICKTNKRYCVLGCIDGKKMNQEVGMVFSASCNINLDEAVKSIIYELRRAATVILNRLESGELVSNKSTSFNASYHFDYYLIPNNCLHLDWLFRSNKLVNEYQLDVNVQELKIPFEFQWPLYSFFADGDGLQDFYFGAAKFKKVNRRRLRSLSTKRRPLNRRLHVLA